VGVRGCCWAAAPGAGPQCFHRAAAGLFNVSITVAPLAAADACYDLVDVWGFPRGRACAAAGAVEVEASDGPLYLV
jgi:hypothetical protein